MQGEGLEVGEIGIGVGERGEFGGNFKGKVGVREAQEASQFFARGDKIDLGVGEFELGVGVERLLVGEIKVIDRARGELALGEIGGGLVDVGEEMEAIEKLFFGFEGIEGDFDIGGEGDDGIGDGFLGAFEFGGGDFFSQRDDEEVEEVLADGVFGIGLMRGAVGEAPTGGEFGVAQKAGLDEVGLGDADLFEGGLERVVIEEGDLDGGIGSEILNEKLPDGGGDLGVFGGVLVPLNMLADAIVDGGIDIVEGGFGIDGATSEEEGCGQQPQELTG